MEKGSLKVVLIGGSAGSVDVLMRLVPELSRKIGYALVLVLHRRASDDATLEEVLSHKTSLPVIAIEDKTRLAAGSIFVAPPDYHLLFEPSGELSLDISEKVNYSRPSIDVSFESAARVFQSDLVAILLTGANADGTQGLVQVQKNQGYVIVQDPESAEIPYMPAHALENLVPDAILDVFGISEFLKDGRAV